MDFDLNALLAGVGDASPVAAVSISADDFSAFMGGLQALPDDDAPPPDDDELEPTEIRAKAPNGQGAPRAVHDRKYRGKRKQRQIDNIAILDFETDPFDNVSQELIFPFLAVLYSDNFEPIIIWEEDNAKFVAAVIAAIESLPEAYTIYAHNGGKFDYMFLMSKLKGRMMFKGRGIMTAEIGKHELRDSFHIIPDRLANFKKDHIDYEDMRKDKRNAHRDEIVKYCINDCKYLLDIVKGFAQRFGLKLSIGQAAMAKIREDYKFERLSDTQDAFFRDFFFGGRVECLQGRIRRKEPYKLYDVNSMYPFVMAEYQHPIGNVYFQHPGPIGPDTIFIDITCNSRGAFILKDGLETKAPHGRYRFKTTIWEYRVAKKHNLISSEEIHACIDMPLRTNFAKFVRPLYDERQVIKAKLNAMREAGLIGTTEYDELVKDDMFMKFLLNNGYGKFAQNPRRYKENYVTEVGGEPEDGADAWCGSPLRMCEDYWIWQRPSPSDRFNNVATGASITGAARSVLLDAICNSVDPVYCDTDSLICRELTDVKIHKTELGAWDLETEMSEIIVCGKKLYGYTKTSDGKQVTKAKGSSQLGYDKIERLFNGETVDSISFGVTLTKAGDQYYMKRRINATVTVKDEPDDEPPIWRCSVPEKSGLSRSQ